MSTATKRNGPNRCSGGAMTSSQSGNRKDYPIMSHTSAANAENLPVVVTATKKPDDMTQEHWERFGYRYIDIPCRRRGCDSEGGSHREDADDSDIAWMVSVVTHKIDLGGSINVEASGDRPWHVWTNVNEVYGDDDLEAFAREVRAAVNVCLDLNAGRTA